MIKKVIFTFLLVIPFVAFSQDLDLDEEYLDSLPEGVREDVMEKIEAQEESEKPVYRRASSMIDKRLKKKLEKMTDDEIVELEASYVFGKKIFDMMQSTFMPVNEPNIDSSYVLDFGDILEIQIISLDGSLDEYPIKRDGSINIPDVGKIYLSGLSLSEASALIQTKIKTKYIGAESYVSLTNIRDIQVLVSGNAYNPGIYTLNGNSNILHALNMAGGIDEIGSYRSIDLIRNNEIVDSIDLYEMFIFGKSDFGSNLRTGDSIFVNSSKKIATIVSGVKRPGKYEMKDSETIKDLIRFSNDFKSEANTANITHQTTKNGNILNSTVSVDDIAKIVVSDGDLVIISEYEYLDVEILGAVINPGKYKILNGETLSDLILKSGGYKESAYPFGGFLNNIKSEEINLEAKDKLYNQFIMNLIDSKAIGAADSTESLPLILENLKDSPVSGRVIAEFDLDVIASDPFLDTALEDGDKIIIPNITQQIYIYGEVSNQGAVRYSPNKNTKYYLDRSGGVLNTADNDNIFIVHPNGVTQRMSSRSNIFSMFGGIDSDVLIYPGSVIYVPRSTNITDRTTIAAIWAPIVSSLALSIASISALNNN